MKNNQQKIEGMKAQTFGVEVEGNNITRQHAAEVAAKYFGTGNYSYTGAINGYRTWSAWDAQGREWKFQRDSSIAGPDDERCELVTPILRYEDIEFFQQLLRELRSAGMKSNPRRGCGVHIHVGLKGLDGRDHDAKSLRNLANIMASHEELIGRAIWIDESRTEHYCQVVSPEFIQRLNKEKPKTMDDLKQVWYQANNATWGQEDHYNCSRYHMLNLHASFTKGTVEFRMFQFSNPHGDSKGGIHAGRMKAYIQLCLAMSEAAKNARSASPEKPQSENDKWAMRIWIRNLGMIGEEFETARHFLVDGLTGCTYRRYAQTA